jgi:hypothetical protein
VSVDSCLCCSVALLSGKWKRKCYGNTFTFFLVTLPLLARLNLSEEIQNWRRHNTFHTGCSNETSGSPAVICAGSYVVVGW